MARLRHALLLLTALAAGCAGGGPRPRTDVAADGSTDYLQGVSSDYSIRLSEMPNHEALGEDTALRQGLIAGDREIHVAAAAFRRAGHYALDLIVNNRTDLPMELQRGDVRLVDAQGRWLQPVTDFPGAEDLGLRGKSARRTSTFPYDGLGLYDPVQEGEPMAYATTQPAAKGNPGDPHGATASPARGLVHFDWETTTPTAPERLAVPAGEGRAWWAYWRADAEPVFPLTAFVTVEGKHMIFLFED
jgi:hypothetical protein